MGDVEGPIEQKDVGLGVTGHLFNPENPQEHLQNSFHPYAPFPGNALKWRSNLYADGTTYEGLMRDEIPHGRGVLTVGPGELGGGGLAEQKFGDRYEGEFISGFAMGMGQYSSSDGTMYRGEFMFGKKEGCGVLTDLSPFHKKLAKGVDPQRAWKATKDEIESKAIYGTWLRDSFVGGPDDSGQLCHLQEILGVVEEVEEVVARARMFAWKPDGDATLWLMRDKDEVPVAAQQHPLQYPHGTGFLMPGPAGNAFPIPENPTLRKELTTAAKNHMNIWASMNVEYDPKPGSLLDKALKLWSKKEKKIEEEKKKRAEMERRRIAQMEKLKGLKEDGKGKAAGTASKKSAGKAGADEAEGKGKGKAVASSAAGKKKAPPPPESDDESGSDFDDDDLIAEGPKMPGGSAFASVTMGLSRAFMATHRMFERAVKKAQRLPKLGQQ